MIKAVIFDMYETLITLFESPLYMAKQICADVGISEPVFREIWDVTDEDRTLGKKTLEEVIEAILRKNARYSEELFETVIEKRKRSRAECFEHLHPGIIPMLSAIKQKNIKIGLITNCYFEESEAIRGSLLFRYFDAVCMSCELGMKKPDPGIFQECIKALAVAPEECLYVGDGGSGELEAALAMGMNPVQAVWYLKEGTTQPVGRKEGFLHMESPMDIVGGIEKYNE